MVRFIALDPLVGETSTAVRAVELAMERNWSLVQFESDSQILCFDVLNPSKPLCWKIEAMIYSL